jgi:hypothetical protein
MSDDINIAISNSETINATIVDDKTINVVLENGVGQDTKTIKVSYNDTTDDYLENKITSGDGIIITKKDSGSNESLEISSSNPTIEWGEILGNISDQTDLQNALDLKATIVDLDSHMNDLSNPHEVTKTQVGLSDVDNTSDLDKPISDATQSALDLKYDSDDFNNDFDTRFGIKNTGDLSEGTNLYYTELRVSSNTDVIANTNARHDAVTVTDSSEIDFTLTGQDITASLKSGSIDETKLDSSVNSSLDLADSSIQSSDLSTALGDYVPYSGSTSNVNLGVYNFSTTGDINADSFITNSGTSSDFVKGDGSLDSNTYLTTETDPVFSSSQASNITSTDITNLGNLSGINSGDQTSSDFDIKDLTDSTNLKTTWNNKQNELISGTNIKTINSESLLGSGNIDISGGTENSFETVSKNLKSYPYVLNYNSGELSSIVYTIGGDSITKTFNYSSGVLNSIVLSGDTPSGIDLTKTLNYSSGVLIGVSYL